MNMYKIPPIVLVGWIIFGVINLSCAQTARFSNNIAQIEMKLIDETPVVVIVKTEKYSDHVPYKNGGWWGTELLKPRFLITEVEIFVNKDKIFVPLSAYCDLANPQKLSLDTTEKDFLLSIYGGETATAYKAELRFNKLSFQKRKVFHREFPQEAWEETVYSFNLGDK